MSTATTCLERDFDPAAVQELKAAATSDRIMGGANLAARAFAADLVDECQLFVWPMLVGGQTGPAAGSAPTSSSSTSTDLARASYASSMTMRAL